jgi:hypothetical protein
MSRLKQCRINLLRARMAAVGADLLLRVGVDWEPNGSREASSNATGGTLCTHDNNESLAIKRKESNECQSVPINL